MKRRKFVKSIGVLAIGCMSAVGLSWEPQKTIIRPDFCFWHPEPGKHLMGVWYDCSMVPLSDYFAKNKAMSPVN